MSLDGRLGMRAFPPAYRLEEVALRAPQYNAVRHNQTGDPGEVVVFNEKLPQPDLHRVLRRVDAAGNRRIRTRFHLGRPRHEDLEATGIRPVRYGRQLDIVRRVGGNARHGRGGTGGKQTDQKDNQHFSALTLGRTRRLSSLTCPAMGPMLFLRTGMFMAIRPELPIIGVALSSGGAAGLAHVGVLEELCAAGLPVDCVAGTSAGAIVGATYAADHLEEFSSTMRALTRRRALWLFDPTWPQTGLLEGRRGLDLIRPYVGRSIEALPRRFAAVATDLESGAEVVMKEGDIIEAIRASMAIPGIFTPQRWQERILVDGGLVNPIPVSAARQLGAEFVVAVSVLDMPDAAALPVRDSRSVSAQLLARFLARIDSRSPSPHAPLPPPSPPSGGTPESPPGLITILSKATQIAQARIAAGRLYEQPPDYLINIQLPDVGLFDFHRSGEAIDAGREAARQTLPALRDALERRAPLYQRVSRWLDHTAGRRGPAGDG